MGAFSIVFWLIFFKFKWLKLSLGWGIISAFFVLHVLLVFVIGLRFVTPFAANATVVQQIIARELKLSFYIGDRCVDALDLDFILQAARTKRYATASPDEKG